MNVRPRINRWTQSRRNLIFDLSIKSSLVQPHFVVSGEGIDEPISSMPGINRQSVDKLIQTISYDNVNFFVTSKYDEFSLKAKYWLEINKEINLVNLRSND